MKTKKKTDSEIKEKVSKLAEDAATEDSAVDFMNPKKGRGRPKGSKNKDETTIPSGASAHPLINPDVEKNKPLVKPVFQMMSNVGVRVAEDERAAIDAADLEVMVDAAANCVHQYLPNAMSAHAHLIVLSIMVSKWGMNVYMLRQQNLAKLRASLGDKKPATEEMLRSPAMEPTLSN